MKNNFLVKLFYCCVFFVLLVSSNVFSQQVQITPINGGIAAGDGNTGDGYIMYSNQSVHSRFSSTAPYSDNSDHLIAIKYSGGQWYYDYNYGWVEFSPVSSDVLIAEVDFSNDNISLLDIGPTGTTLYGIKKGFNSGDLNAYANWWNGSSNNGEFTITGTYFYPCDSYIGGGEVYLSDLSFTEISNGWGPIELDKSNGESSSGDGNTMTINGISYLKGLGCHAYSEATWSLGGNYVAFKADIGVDDEVAGGSIAFEVHLDGVKIYQSSVMTGSDNAVSVNLNVSGGDVLKLIITDGGNGIGQDHGNWADARLVISNGGPVYYNLTTNANDGNITLNPPSGTYAEGTEVTVTANANFGYLFNSWSGDISGAVNPIVVIMNSNKSITANFVSDGGTAISITPINYGIATSDENTGSGYIMYSNQNVHNRFSSNAPHPDNSDHFIAVKYSGGQWYYDYNDGWVQFSSVSSDVLIADIDFSNDNISLLDVGVTGTIINEIKKGFDSGDLAAYANRWNGSFNNGEFTILGTYFYLCDSYIGGGEVYLSDLPFTEISNGWGPIELDKSNGESSSGDGNTMTINGTTYSKGLGCHAYSEATWTLGGNYVAFKVDIGVDDEVAGGSIAFEVHLDGAKIYQSSVMTGNDNAISLNLNITGGNVLKLIITDGGNGIGQDHGNWADARLVISNGGPVYYNLTTYSNNGNISLSPSGGTYTKGTVVTVTANANTGYQFDGWSGDLSGSANPTTIIMNTNKSITASFVSNGGEISIIPINNGIAAGDGNTGSGYIMYSNQSVHSRFSSTAPHSDNSDHLIAIKYSGGQWYYDYNYGWVEFSPISSDIIIAEVDFSNDNISLLDIGPTGTTIYGIKKGFNGGDLNAYANLWNGSFNNGEFTITGSYFYPCINYLTANGRL